jgi:hypothetical protein
MAGRRYFTDTTFEQSTDEPFMGVTAEQIAAQNQTAIDDQALFESILGNVENQRIAGADTTGTTGAATTGTTGTTFPEGTDGNGVVSNSVLDGFGEVVNTTGTGQLTSAQLKQAVLDGTMDYNTAYGLLGIADAVNPFGFTEDEKLTLGISESQRTGQGYKQNPTTGAMDLYDYDTNTFVTETGNTTTTGTTGTTAVTTNTLSPAQRLYYDTLMGMSGQGSPDEIYDYVSQLADVQALMSAANINDVPVKFDEFNRPINFNTVQEYYAGTLSELDASDGIDADEQKLIADSITNNYGGGFNIDEIATRYDAQPMDVVEGLLRGGFQTPEQITAMYQVNNPDFDEPRLIATLLEEGKTTVDEVVAYYKDQYPDITAEQVVKAFRDLGGTRQFAQGGDINGYYLGGTTDGMADRIPATIDNMQPAALSDGEFVIPADVVGHLGNGNSDAGAQNLYSMMERVRKDRTGNPEQGRQIDPNKYLA